MSIPLRYTMKLADPAWSQQIKARFYAKGTDLLGLARVFSGLEIMADLGANDEDPTVTIHYTASFGGSRDLTPGPINSAAK
jgi:hypothetical protein